MTLTAPEIAAISALCLLAGCQHVPKRDGVWITVPREMVRCEATAAGVVCGSVRALRVEDVGI